MFSPFLRHLAEDDIVVVQDAAQAEDTTSSAQGVPQAEDATSSPEGAPQVASMEDDMPQVV